MNQSQFKKGIVYATIGSLWWGVLGTIFFKYVSMMGALEVTLHRLIWTSLILLLTTLILKKVEREYTSNVNFSIGANRYSWFPPQFLASL